MEHNDFLKQLEAHARTGVPISAEAVTSIEEVYGALFTLTNDVPLPTVLEIILGMDSHIREEIHQLAHAILARKLI